MARWIPLAIVGLAVVAMSPSLAGDFVIDDHAAIEASTCVTGGLDLAAIVGRNFWCQPPGEGTVDAWRPVPVLLWWVCWQLGGGSPLPFHLLSILVHALCTWHGWKLGQRLGLDRHGLALAMIWFAVLPIHVEAVASLVGIADALRTLFLVLALRALLEGRGAWAPVCTAAAFMSKETGIVAVPLVLLATMIASGPRRRPWGWSALAAVPPLALLGVRAAVLGSIAGQHTSLTQNPLLALPWSARIPTAFDLLARYARLVVAPFPLSADYSFAAFEVSGSWTRVGVAVGVLLVVSMVTLALRARREREVLWLWLWLFGELALLSHLAVVLPAILAERLFYGPSLPLALLLGRGWAAVRPRLRETRWVFASAALYLAVLTALSMVHAFAWTTAERITRATQLATPGSVRAHVWRARVLLRAGRAEDAEEAAAQALALLPAYGLPYAQRGIALDLQGRPKEALAWLRQGFERDPAEGEVAELFVQFLLKYGHEGPARHVLQEHARARGGKPAAGVAEFFER